MKNNLIDIDNRTKFITIPYLLPYNKKITITAAVICKNEERCIKRCLLSLMGKFDEIIIIDTGSEDSTINIINELKTNNFKLYSLEWNDNFSEVRNFALEKSNSDYILFIDADEELLSKKNTIINAFTFIDSQHKNTNFILCPMIIDQNGHESIGVPRGFKLDNSFYYYGYVHEEIRSRIHKELFTIHYKIRIYHDGYTIEEMNNKDKINRNLRLINKNIEEEPNNIKWMYFYYRDSFDRLDPHLIINNISMILKKDKEIDLSQDNIINSEFSYAMLDLIAKASLYILPKENEFSNILNLMDIIAPNNTNSLYYKSIYQLLIWKNMAHVILQDLLSFKNDGSNHYGMINSKGYHINAALAFYMFECGFYSNSKEIFDYLLEENFDIDLIKKYYSSFLV
ncbi:glycosyltransferase [Photobacterium damselae]|uniref:glycosyltransferase n=2 Tax=Photobacterium damselae TaxID=38293 RepID=UPI0015A41747|nr:glycosyltransferase [Photobacterium damselae]NVO75317.1 glycosyltransferase [Photobacterium damselae subsp. damselae]